jgi:hypothetical protein
MITGVKDDVNAQFRSIAFLPLATTDLFLSRYSAVTRRQLLLLVCMAGVWTVFRRQTAIRIQTYRWQSSKHEHDKYKFRVFWDVAPCIQGDSPYDVGSMHLWNFGPLQREYTALRPRKLNFLLSAVENLKSNMTNTHLKCKFRCADKAIINIKHVNVHTFWTY